MLVFLVHRLIWIIFRPIVGIFCNFTVIGQENLKKSAPPFIFVSNHESHFDPFLISAGTPIFRSIMAIRFFARDVFFEHPVMKRALWLLGAYPGRIGQGFDKAALTPLTHLEKGRSVGIFPDWCFPDEPEASRMRYISPYISLMSKRPIVPVFLFGIENLSWTKIFARRKKIIIIFGQPIHPKPESELGRYAEEVERGLLQARLRCVKELDREGESFWRSYAAFYKYLELAEPYQKMKRVIDKLVPHEPKGQWLDLGTGSGAMVSLLLERQSARLKGITATDFSNSMLAVVRERFRGNPLVKIEAADLADRLPYPTQAFDGAIANLVLPYVVHHRFVFGRQALVRTIAEIHRALKPGGFLLWSTPKRNVNFLLVALASWQSLIDRKHPEYRYYAFHILRHALTIQEWGRREIYNFPDRNEIETIMKQVGFASVTIKLSLATQAYVISGRKHQAKEPSVITLNKLPARAKQNVTA